MHSANILTVLCNFIFFEIIYKKSVAPAKAGVQFWGVLWIPAFAGMTFPEVLFIKLHSTVKETKNKHIRSPVEPPSFKNYPVNTEPPPILYCAALFHLPPITQPAASQQTV